MATTNKPHQHQTATLVCRRAARQQSPITINRHRRKRMQPCTPVVRGCVFVARSSARSSGDAIFNAARPERSTQRGKRKRRDLGRSELTRSASRSVRDPLASP